jgi:hypothetical protein
LAYSSAMKIEAVRSSETSMNLYRTKEDAVSAILRRSYYGGEQYTLQAWEI